MGRKGVRVSKEEKLMIVEQICSGQMSVIEGSRQLRIVESKVRYMTKLYCKHGPLAFVDSGKNNVYSAETKLHAVLSYLQGEGSLDEVASNYGLRSIEPLRKWIKMYNDGELFLQRKMSGGSRMTTSRPTTKEERIKIVMECIAHGYNYGEIAIKYNVSYQQVYGWVQRFKELGEAGLEDRRGKRKLNQEPRSEVENLQIEVERLKHQLYMAEMERDLLKKLNELERENPSHK